MVSIIQTVQQLALHFMCISKGVIFRHKPAIRLNTLRPIHTFLDQRVAFYPCIHNSEIPTITNFIATSIQNSFTKERGQSIHNLAPQPRMQICILKDLQCIQPTFEQKHIYLNRKDEREGEILNVFYEIKMSTSQTFDQCI